ncbi:MAG: alpha/beta fold hydrolase [Myxococcales bacterium]|nr:alpha/beta fold hydrolase [Myxococcales bacterium]USN51866.1 MAG: alpha/beta fold hydrolase [Myxococcales bacterium]
MKIAKRFFFTIVLGITCSYIVSCAMVGLMKTDKDTRFLKNSLWIDEPTDQNVQAVVILLHGLNLKPAKMDDWAHLLQNHGALVVRFALFGHSGEKDHMSQVDENIWRQQFHNAMLEAQSQAQHHKVPIYFLGFSLGALVGLEWLAQQEKAPSPSISKMVLIAPAIATPWYSKAAVSFMSWFGRTLTMPSRSPKEYRANPGTSVAAYQALFALKNSLEKTQFKNTNIPTLLMIDKHDELVPSKSIKKIINSKRLSKWILDTVDNHFAYDNYGFRHLMVDENAVGKTLWEELEKKVTNHFGLTN